MLHLLQGRARLLSVRPALPISERCGSPITRLRPTPASRSGRWQQRFVWEPATGTLNGARGDPTPLTVSVDGSNLAGGQSYQGYLVVDTEESKFTYHVIVDVV